MCNTIHATTLKANNLTIVYVLLCCVILCYKYAI